MHMHVYDVHTCTCTWKCTCEGVYIYNVHNVHATIIPSTTLHRSQVLWCGRFPPPPHLLISFLSPNKELGLSQVVWQDGHLWAGGRGLVCAGIGGIKVASILASQSVRLIRERERESEKFFTTSVRTWALVRKRYVRMSIFSWLYMEVFVSTWLQN